MGQPITVVEKPSTANPAIVRLETNRPLSGMGHEQFDAPPPEILDRPVDELARRLFAAGGVERVHINGSVVTVTLLGGRTGEGLGDIVRHLFLHYGDGAAADAAPAAAPAAEEDRTPEMMADPAEAPSATEAAGTAPDAEAPGGDAPEADAPSAENPAPEDPGDDAPASA